MNVSRPLIKQNKRERSFSFIFRNPNAVKFLWRKTQACADITGIDLGEKRRENIGLIYLRIIIKQKSCLLLLFFALRTSMLIQRLNK